MNKTISAAVLSAIVGALIVFGYFKFVAAPPGPPHPCPGGDRHCIEVSVIVVDEKPQIAPIPDLEVRDQGATISWMIATPGYTFPDQGIAFDKPSNPPSTPTDFEPSGAPTGRTPWGNSVTRSSSRARRRWRRWTPSSSTADSAGHGLHRRCAAPGADLTPRDQADSSSHARASSVTSS
jgi:hypothetical protein